MESTTKRSSAESAAEPLGPDGRAGPIPLPSRPPAGGDAAAGRIELRAVGAERLERVRTTTAHCTIVTVDIEGFGRYSRNNTNMVRVRHGLYLAMRHAFDTAGIVWESCRREDRGDGILVLAPADIPKTLFVDHLPDTLLDALAGHNRIHPGEEQIRLRLAIHAGEINYDEHGVTGASIVHAFRLLDSAELKQALEETAAVLAFAGSGWFFDEVIRHSERSRAQDYRATDITNKETTTRAWIRLLPA